MNKKDLNTFSITFRTTNEGYNYILGYIEAHTELISDRILPDTKELYKTDNTFKQMLKTKATMQRDIEDYIYRYNK